MDRGTWWAAVHGIAKSQTRLSGWHTNNRATLTNYRKLSDLKQQTHILSQFWRLEIPQQGVGEVGSSWSLGGESLPFFSPSCQRWPAGLSIPRLVAPLAVSASSLCLSCPTFCDPMNCNQPGSSVHEIFQARIHGVVAISYSGGSSWTRNWTHVYCKSYISHFILYYWASWEAIHTNSII